MPILALHGFTGRGSDFAPFANLLGSSLSERVYPAIHTASENPFSPSPGRKPAATNTVASGLTPQTSPDRKSTWPDWLFPDFPGHGPNPQMDCSPEAALRLVSDAATLTKNTQNGSPRILLGYSMGARAALLHAINYPHLWDALIVISGNPGIEDPAVRAERVKADEALAQSLERMGVAGFLDFWQETPLIRSQKNIPDAWRETMLQNRKRHTVEGLASSLRQFGQGSCPNLWPLLGELAMPTCVISGANDRKYTEIAARLVKRLPHERSRHAVIEAASPMPHLEQAETTAKVVREFLANL